MAGPGGRKYVDTGLLILRIGIGVVFIMHGWPKLMGGPEKWAVVGKAVGVYGISFAPAFWGFMAAFSEMVGGLAILTGFLIRPFAGLLLITMITASAKQIGAGDGFTAWSHAVSMAIVFLALIFTGAGKFTVPALVRGMKNA
jgi:putative oxidoreductase